MSDPEISQDLLNLLEAFASVLNSSDFFNSSDFNRSFNGSNPFLNLSDLNGLEKERFLRYSLIVFAYSLVVIVSLTGNSLVCYIVWNKKSLRTLTNIAIANLAASDLLMTCLNIPFTCARLLMNNWIFGQTLCSLVPFVQVLSVYVSSLTMTFIAIDRFQAILYPLKPKFGQRFSPAVVIAVIWTVSAVLSIPYSTFNRVQEVFTFRRVVRCQVRYPEPAETYSKTINLLTFITQYVIPLSVTVVAYCCIGVRIWFRSPIGFVTKQQRNITHKTRKQTVKMLIIVVLVFALCWFPLNMYHFLVEFTSFRTSFQTLVTCHLIAMSSVCYNPFIYFWLNPIFRQLFKNKLFCCCFRANAASEEALIRLRFQSTMNVTSSRRINPIDEERY